MRRKNTPMQLMGNTTVLLKQAKRAQKNMKEAKKRLARQEFSYETVSGSVKLCMMGDRSIKSLQLNAEAVQGNMDELSSDVSVVFETLMKQITEAESGTNNASMADLQSTVRESIRNGEMSLGDDADDQKTEPDFGGDDIA